MDQARVKDEPLPPTCQDHIRERRPALPSNRYEARSQDGPLTLRLRHKAGNPGHERPQGADYVRAQDEPLPPQSREETG